MSLAVVLIITLLALGHLPISGLWKSIVAGVILVVAWILFLAGGAIHL